MSSLRMTSMSRSPYLKRRRERQQRDVPRLLDRVREPPLVRSADARNAPGNDLPPLRHERMQQLRVLVIDVVDPLDAETAHFLAPEVLLLLGDDSLVASRRPLRGAPWSSSRFRH